MKTRSATTRPRRSLLATVTAEWERIHARVFRGKAMRCVVRYVSDIVEEVRFVACLARRVEGWSAEMVVGEAVYVETFLLPLGGARERARGSKKSTRRA